MNIPEGFLLVPAEPIGVQLRAALLTKGIIPIYRAMIAAVPPVELPAYDYAKEVAACRACWEKNPQGVFSDFWLGWKACAQSRDGSVSDE